MSNKFAWLPNWESCSQANVLIAQAITCDQENSFLTLKNYNYFFIIILLFKLQWKFSII